MTASSNSLVLKALDGLSMRAEVTAQNIANAGTSGYRPLRVTFEQALKNAAASSRTLSDVHPKIEAASLEAPDGELRLDLELATASSTSSRYAALVELLNRTLQLDALAVSQGR